MTWPEGVDFVLLDFETTGLNPESGDKVVEYAFMVVRDGQVIRKVERLVNPLRPMGLGATSINQITDEMLINQPRFDQVGGELWHALKDSVMVAHKANFDARFLASEFRQGNWEMPNFTILDSIKIAQHVWTKEAVDNFQLTTLARHVGHDYTMAHRAMADVEAMFSVLSSIFSQYPNTFDIEKLKNVASIPVPKTQSSGKISNLAEELKSLYGMEIEIEFKSKSRGLEKRRVRPQKIFLLNHEYMEAYCYTSMAEKTFRIDNIRSITNSRCVELLHQLLEAKGCPSRAIVVVEKIRENGIEFAKDCWEKLLYLWDSSPESSINSPNWGFNFLLAGLSSLEAMFHIIPVRELVNVGKFELSWKRKVILHSLLFGTTGIGKEELRAQITSNREYFYFARDCLEDEHRHVQVEALNVISSRFKGEIKAESIVKNRFMDLVKIWGNKDDRMCDHTAFCIRRDWRTTEMAKFLVTQMGDNNPIICSNAIFASAWPGNSIAVGPIIGVLNNPDPDVRANAFGALGVIRDKRALPFVLEMSDINSLEMEVQRAVVYCIGRMGDATHIPILLDYYTKGEKHFLDIDSRSPDEFFGRNAFIEAVNAFAMLGDESIIPTLIEHDHIEAIGLYVATNDLTNVTRKMIEDWDERKMEEDNCDITIFEEYGKSDWAIDKGTSPFSFPDYFDTWAIGR